MTALLQSIDEAVSLINAASIVSTKSYQEDITEILNNYEIEKRNNDYPYSIKCFMKWAHFMEKEKKIIDLDFDKIDNDIKYQYLLYYKNNPEYLKSMYYNYNVDKYDFMDLEKIEKCNLENRQIFGNEDNHTIIHYILCELSLTDTFVLNKTKNEKDITKIIEQGVMIIKLLLKNKIITGEETYNAGTLGESIYERIKVELICIDQWISDDNKYKQKYIDIYFEFLLFCMKLRQKLYKNDIYTQESIMMLEITEHGFWKTQNIFQSEHDYGGYKHYRFKAFMSNKTGLIQRLLFRGISPFSFCIKKGTHTQYIGDSDINQQCDDYDFNKNLFWNLCRNELSTKIVNRFMWRKMHNKIAATAPLIVFPFLDQVKMKMCHIICQSISSNCFIKEIANIIVSYLFIGNQYDFYDKTFYDENELDIKTYEFFNWIGQITMDENSIFHQVFNVKFNNFEFAKYIIDKHSNELLSMFILERNVNIQYLYKLIVLYPPKLRDFYYLIFGLVKQKYFRNNNFKHLQYVLQFLKHIQSVYGQEFDINYSWIEETDDHYEIELKDEGEDGNILNLVLITLSSFRQKESDEAVKLIEYILENTDINVVKGNVFYYALKTASIQFVFTILKTTKFKQYSVELLCNDIIKWMDGVKIWPPPQSNDLKRMETFVGGMNNYLISRIDGNKQNDSLIQDIINKLKHWIENIPMYKI